MVSYFFLQLEFSSLIYLQKSYSLYFQCLLWFLLFKKKYKYLNILFKYVLELTKLIWQYRKAHQKVSSYKGIILSLQPSVWDII